MLEIERFSAQTSYLKNDLNSKPYNSKPYNSIAQPSRHAEN